MLHAFFKKNTGGFVLLFAVLLSCSFLWADVAHAATISFSPSVSTVSVGNIVTVKALVNTAGKAINNADSIIQFPSDLLEVISVSKGGSVFSLWVEEPSFSNPLGRVTFNGGLPNPGFNGVSGEMVSVVFKAKKTGVATIAFSDSAVRENDGLGTDILTAKQSTTLQIGASVPVVPSLAGVPVKPTVTSSTHSEQESWYTETTAILSWVIPSGVSSIQTLLTKNPNETPTLTYDSSVSQRTVTDIANGVSYFHLRYMNAAGWGPTAHYKIQIDNVSPDAFLPRVRIENSKNIVVLDATDATSGIDSYSLQIDNYPALTVRKDSIKNGEYELPVQTVGDHSLQVVAYDKAGNKTEAHTSFLSPQITAPKIVLSSETVQRGESVIVNGTSAYARVPVEVFTQINDKKIKVYSATTGDDGSFTITSEKLNTSGSLHVWAQLVFSESVQSPLSEKVEMQVDDSLVVQTSLSLIYTLAFVIPTIILIIILTFIMYLGWHKFFGLRRKLQDDLDETVKETHKAFTLFKEELGLQLEKLEKIKEDRDLNKKEEKIFKQLQSNIDDIDEFIHKRLRKIT